MKTWAEQNAEIWEREAQTAKNKGFDNVYAYRAYLAEQNKRKTYIAKIAHYKRAIEEMEAWLNNH